MTRCNVFTGVIYTSKNADKKHYLTDHMCNCQACVHNLLLSFNGLVLNLQLIIYRGT